MTRSPRDQVFVKPGNDVYTGLAAVACLIVLLGILSLVLQSNAVFNDGLFLTNGGSAAGSVR